MAEEVGRSESEDNCVQISSRLWKKRYQNAKTRFSVPAPPPPPLQKKVNFPASLWLRKLVEANLRTIVCRSVQDFGRNAIRMSKQGFQWPLPQKGKSNEREHSACL